MRKIYEAADLQEAQLLLDLLAHHGIHAQLLNSFAHGALGELPFTHAYPEIWLRHESDLAAARTLIYGFERRPRSDAHWTCPHCAEPNPDTFEICWHCGTERR